MLETLIINAVAGTVYSLWEYYLGETKSIDANSTVKLVQNGGKKLFAKIFKK